MSALPPVEPRFTVNNVDNQHAFEQTFWRGINMFVMSLKDVSKANTAREKLNRIITVIINSITILFFCPIAGAFAIYGSQNRLSKLKIALTTNQPLTTLFHYFYRRDKVRGPGSEKPLNIYELCAFLKVNQTLKTIEIWDNTLSPKALKQISKALENNKTVTSLTIHGAPQSLSSVEALGKLLHNNSTLTTLSLENCGIQDSGIEIIARSLTTNTSLTSLNLRNNSISSHGATSLIWALNTNNKTLKELDLTKNKRVNFSCATHIIQNTMETGLEKIHFGLSSIMSFGIEHFSNALLKNENLKTLVLSGDRPYSLQEKKYKLDSESMTHLTTGLKGNDALKSLVLRAGAIANEAIPVLAQFLAENTTLESFEIIDNKLTTDSTCTLLQALISNKTITSLKLKHSIDWGNLSKNPTSLHALASNTTITSMDLSDNFSFNKNSTIQVLKHIIENNSTLKHLNLKGCCLFEAHLQELLSVLDLNTTLTTIELDDYNVKPSTLASINRILERNRLASSSQASTSTETV